MNIYRLILILMTILLISVFLASPSPALAEEKENEDEKPVELEIETTVSAPPIEKFLVTTSVITKEDIEKNPGRDMADLLRDQNGVFSPGIANKKGKADIDIRGFGMNYIRVFIDGVPLNTANDRTVDFSLIPTEYIERIEVIKGPAPVIYGSDSMGGIINIVTKSGRDNKAIYAKLTGGGFGYADGSAVVGGGNKKLGYFVMAKSRKTDGYRDHTAENFTDLFLKADYDLQKDTNLSFFFFNTNGYREAPNAVNPDGSMRKQTSGFWAGSYDWEYSDILQQGWSLKVEHKPEKKIGYMANIYYRTYQDTLLAYVDPGTQIKPPASSPFAYYQAGAWNYSYWDSKVYGGDLRFLIPLKSHKLTVGGSVERDAFQDTYTGRSNPNDPEGSLSRPKEEWNKDYLNPWRDLKSSSLYIQDEIKLDPKLTLTLGLRNDSYSETSTSLNGIANLVYNNGNNTWRATVGKTGRFPTLKELEGSSGNSDLVPESAWNYELGYRHRQPKFLDVEAAVYYSTIKNLIEHSDPNDSSSIYENISQVKILGAEANVIKKWNNLQARLGYTYTNRVSPSSSWEEVPRNKFLADVRWEKEKSLCWAIQGVAVSDRKTGDDEIDTLPGYGIVNLLVAYPSFGTKSDSKIPWNVEVKVTNLFDKEYQNRLYYPCPGRWVTGSIKYRF